MSKKDQSFFRNKARVLQGLGIEAQPITEMVAVDVQYNENQVAAIASGKGQSVEQFMKEVDAMADDNNPQVLPIRGTREIMAEAKDNSASTKEVKASAAKKPAAKRKSRAKAPSPKKVEADTHPAPAEPKDVKEVGKDD